MTTRIRSILALAAVTIILVACGTTTGDARSQTPEPATPSVQPSDAPSEQPSEAPAETPEPVGVLTAADGAVVDGPGTPLEEALAGDLSQPILVRGTLFLDTDGTVYLADSLTDASAPEFGDLRVVVENYPNDGPTWDMAEADVTGLQEANGIRFFEDTKLYGTISQ
ncbi:MAG: hypothetical protein M3Y29_06980 [Chloroflexota bacterium]|jgi:hypothetical protein|nr:hypothetical protein [Chloroflexota bacterium]